MHQSYLYQLLEFCNKNDLTIHFDICKNRVQITSKIKNNVNWFADNVGTWLIDDIEQTCKTILENLKSKIWS